MQSWPQTSTNRWTEAIAASADTALVAERRYEFGALTRTWLRRFAPMLARPSVDTHLWRLRRETRTEIAHSQFETGCAATGEGLVCAAYDGTRTHIASVAIETGAVTPVATLDGRFSPGDSEAGEWITGWWDTTPAAIRTGTRDAFRAAASGDDFPILVAPGEAVVAVVSSTDDGSRLRVYPWCKGCGG
jgi:hypothetical protein